MLLSPHRQARGEMWGTDGVHIATVVDGMVWIFSSVESLRRHVHRHHAAVTGHRFAAADHHDA
jgi:hypothetical protein